MTQIAAIEKKKRWALKQFNWRALLVRMLVNALTLFLTVLFTPSIGFIEPTIWKIAFLGLMLGVVNAILRPIIQFFTLSYIFATYGLIVIVINALLLYVLSWLFPSMLYIDNVLWALWGGALMGILGGFLESLFGLTLPIVDDSAISEPMRREVQKQAQRQKIVLPDKVVGQAMQPLEEAPHTLPKKEEQPLTGETAPQPAPQMDEASIQAEQVQEIPVEQQGSMTPASVGESVEEEPQPESETMAPEAPTPSEQEIVSEKEPPPQSSTAVVEEEDEIVAPTEENEGGAA